VKQGDDVPAFLPIGGPIPVRQTSSTHGGGGYITNNPAEIEAAVERLQRKIESQVDSFSFHELEQRQGARTLIVAYGVTARAAQAACNALFEGKGVPVSLLVLKTLWPVPEKVLRDAAAGMERVLVVEMNLGQYVNEVRRVLCGKQVDFFGRMCGELITPSEIMQEALHG
jgi:2-oxoglutarate ferredoxin oxidoreductase subunit alpha